MSAHDLLSGHPGPGAVLLRLLLRRARACGGGIVGLPSSLGSQAIPDTMTLQACSHCREKKHNLTHVYPTKEGKLEFCSEVRTV